MSIGASSNLGPFLRDLVASGHVSSVTARAIEDGRVADEGAAGWRDLERRLPAGPDTVYDFASLTKVATATLALVLHRDGRLSLDTPVGDLAPEAVGPWAERTLDDCLRHRAGLPAWAPLYALDLPPEEALGSILEGRFVPVEVPTYSDLGYILWAWLAERVTEIRLGELLSRHVLEPLGMAATGPMPGRRDDVAVCRLDRGRETELARGLGLRIDPLPGPFHGAPQDGNASFLGGLAGHAGLFGPIGDLLRLTSEWLRPQRILDGVSVERALGGEGPYGLGWWRPAAVPALAPILPSGSFGMLGFTGGTFWIDPARHRIAALLGHRIDSAGPAAGWRREFLGLIG